MQADDIREFVFLNYVKPALTSGEDTIKIRAGDVHKAMNLSGRLPAICGALGTKKFEEQYHVKVILREGPSNGSNVFFTYDINI